MKQTLFEQAVKWLVDLLKANGNVLFWGTVGSTISTLLNRSENKNLDRPLWHYGLMFVAGLSCATLFADTFNTWTGLPIGGSGFVLGLIGFGVTSFLVNKMKNPVSFAKELKNFNKNDNESGTI